MGIEPVHFGAGLCELDTQLWRLLTSWVGSCSQRMNLVYFFLLDFGSTPLENMLFSSVCGNCAWRNFCDLFLLYFQGQSFLSKFHSTEVFYFYVPSMRKNEQDLGVFATKICELSSDQVPFLGPRTTLGQNNILAADTIFVPSGFPLHAAAGSP